MFLKYYRPPWSRTKKDAAWLANKELSGTAGSNQSRDYPNALDRSNQDMKNAYPNGTGVGPFSLPPLFRF
jgi:hypothetical protein